LSPTAIAALAPHKVFEGNRPSSTFFYEKMSPRVLGQLIALYEHKVFVHGTLIPSTNKLTAIVADASRSTQDLDSSTAGLIAAARKYGEG
jgi:glucose-6-phosphate isomerase